MQHDHRTHDEALQPQPRWRFEHHSLDAYRVALDALVRGEAIVKTLPRGYGDLADQTKRALHGAFLQTAEASVRTGADRVARFRVARGEAGEAAAAFEGPGGNNGSRLMSDGNSPAVSRALAARWLWWTKFALDTCC